jgi:DNA repair exonuclease SbcCD ATPase subunit
MEVVNVLNAKIAELTKQLNQIQGAIKSLDGIEKKLGALTAKVENNKEPAQTAERVQKLNDELKKIAHNLKGTPGYGIKHSFDCEKCSDHGHVAVMFRCTRCGQERWYGWWPEK